MKSTLACMCANGRADYLAAEFKLEGQGGPVKEKPMSTTEDGITFESLERAFSILARQQTKIEELEKRIAKLDAAYKELEAQLMPEKAKGWPFK